ncbi:MAG: RIP metalloprotease RseP [Candidatus Omnitrophica bacterium]|nr:RIP metalloprotease RseP [Candidatus Omnitrophota bacterium]
MDFLIQLIPTILVLGLLIFIHEMGHFIVCRMTRVRVEKFSIGFGPEIFAWQSKETRYVVSAIPFGGFVKPQGETSEEQPAGASATREGDYLAAPIWARISIVVAGAAMNYILAFVLFALIFMMGKPTLAPVIGDFMEGYPAKESGLQKGDEVVAVGGRPVTSWVELTSRIMDNESDSLALDIKRQTRVVQIVIQPKVEEGKDAFGDKTRLNRIGIMPSEKYMIEKYGFLESFQKGWDALWITTWMTYKALWRLITGRLSLKALSGPIGIVVVTGKAAQLGFVYLLQLTALISATLAIFNLLPFPALDGGHLLFLTIEAIFRRPVSLKIQERLTQIGFFLLIVLMVVVMYNDLVNLHFFEKLKSMFLR